MSDEPFRIDVDQVIENELPAIARRRDPYKPDGSPNVKLEVPEGLSQDLRGLALSGGGIRSASFSLGLVQAFDAMGLMRAFDYLSTVSGGGYLGGYLSSSVSAEPKPKDRPRVSTAEAPELYPGLKEIKFAQGNVSAGQPDRVRRFIFGGKYLHKPWQLANKYLIGLFFNSLAILSGVALVCCAVALAYRRMDQKDFRYLAEIFDLNYDTNIAFLPFIVLLACWLVAWIVSYLWRQAEAPGKTAQMLLYATAAAFLIGCTLILVNGEVTLNYIAQAIFDQDAITHDGTIKSVLLTLIAAGLIPFLRPRALAKRGLHPDGIADRLIFRFSCACLLVGVPLVGVGYFGMQNISRSAGSPEYEFSAGDIYDWGAFCALLVPEDKEGDIRKNIDVPANYPNKKELQELFQKVLDSRDKAGEVRVFEEQRHKEWPYKKNAWPSIDAISNGFQWRARRMELDDLQDKICHDVNQFVLNSPAVANGLVSPLVAKGILKPDASDPASAESANGHDNEYGLLYAVAKFEQTKNLKPPPESPSKSALAAVAARIKTIAKDSTIDVDSDRRDSALEGIRQAMTYKFNGDDREWRAFNQNVLVAARPDCFRHLDEVHRSVVTAPDQATRKKWLAVLALLFLVGLSVDLNATSLHRFYRNRLASAYLEQRRRQQSADKNAQTSSKDDLQPLKLSELDTTAVGAPYHLINASLNRFDSRFGSLLEEFSKERPDGEPDRRSTRNFLFSRLYCGSETTKFVTTENYEKMNRPDLTLADAVAISGAAIDPQQFDFAPLAWMMTGLNLRLGQWLPNPGDPHVRGKSDIRPHTARLYRMLLDIPREIQKRHMCFISDGGFNENLGIIPLLKRRCRLIVAVDAGCDPQEQFADLGRVIRRARVIDGIAITALPSKEMGSAPGEFIASAVCKRTGTPDSNEHFAVGLIEYPCTDDQPAAQGLLVYIKPSFTGDEGVDLVAYRAADDEFPHDSTADQLFDEARVEAYRQLGHHIGMQVFNQLFEGAGDGLNVDWKKVLETAKNAGQAPPLSTEQSLAQIATAIHDYTEPRMKATSLEPGAGIEAVKELAAMYLQLIDFGPLEDKLGGADTFSKLSSKADSLAGVVKRSGGSGEDQKIASALKQLAEAWNSVAANLSAVARQEGQDAAPVREQLVTTTPPQDGEPPSS